MTRTNVGRVGYAARYVTGTGGTVSMTGLREELAAVSARSDHAAERSRALAATIQNARENDPDFDIRVLCSLVDEAAVQLPAVPAALARVAVLDLDMWPDTPFFDGFWPEWDAASLELTSHPYSAIEMRELLTATAEAGTGGQFVLAAAINPARPAQAISDLAWHPEIRRPANRILAMLAPSADAASISELGEPFLTDDFDPNWIVAALLPGSAMAPYPEWEAAMTWFSLQPITGTPAFWDGFLEALEAGSLEGIRESGDDWGLVDWTQIITRTLGELIRDPQSLSREQQDALTLVTERFIGSGWPPAQSLAL